MSSDDATIKTFKAYTTWGTLYGDIRKNAATRRIQFSLTRQEFDMLVSRSEGRCMLTGIPFDASPFTGSMRRPFAPSVDRIDSAQGYHRGNVRLVCVLVNLALNEWGLEPLLRVARNLVEREREIYGNTDVWLNNQNKRKRLWPPAEYVCTKDYLIERYGVDTRMHTKKVSDIARKYCDQLGIEYLYLRPLCQADNLANLANAYPRSVLERVCDELIKSE